jgi:hypothetical protein
MKTQKISKLLNKRFSTPVWIKVSYRIQHEAFLVIDHSAILVFAQVCIYFCLYLTKTAQGTTGS